jgi:hypothetical protein
LERVVAKIRVTHIYVLESLSEGKTGRRLYEDIKALQAFHGRTLEITFRDCPTRSSLLSELDGISKAVVPGGTCFVHIEAHGNPNVLGLADGKDVSWEELGPRFAKINAACGINLFLVVAACFGGYSATAIRLQEPAVYRTCIAPSDEIWNDQLYSAFHAFYSAALEKLDIHAGIAALRNTTAGKSFYIGTAEEMFRLGFKLAFEKHWSGEGLKASAMRVTDKLTALGKPASLGTSETLLKAHAREYFETCYRSYFALEDYPQNKTRFPFSYEDFTA